jgi:hypothetical protein
MGPYTSNGNIRQEDIHACNIARSVIARSLALEAHHTALLVGRLINTLLLTKAPISPINELWEQLQNHPTLRAVARQTDLNVDDYNQFAGWVKGQRSHVAAVQKSRLHDALASRLYAQRFGNSVRLTRLHLSRSTSPS